MPDLSMTENPPQVVISRRAVRRWRLGHPWIFRDEVRPAGTLPAGTIVRVVDERGADLGTGFWSDRSGIALRLFERNAVDVDDLFWRHRLESAVEFRNSVAPGADACRIVSADADGIPGLIADRYGDHLVVQAQSSGADRLLHTFARLLLDILKPKSILARNDPAIRDLEGLPRGIFQMHGETPAEVVIREADVRFAVDLHGGQKTGAFLDQRENRLAAANYCHGRGLDLFCYHGSFALHAAARCESVVAVDSSGPAIARGRANAALNGRESIEFIEANVFDFLKESDRAGRRFDAVMLDPPAFAKRKTDLAAAKRAYKEINLRAMKILDPGGVLVTSSCSYNLDEETFLGVLREAAADARRAPRILERRGAARDHPELLGLPESRYLKCFILRV